MALYFATGFEIGAYTTALNDAHHPDGSSDTAFSLDTSIKYSGGSSITVTAALRLLVFPSPGNWGSSMSFRFYKTTNPASDMQLVGNSSTSLSGLYLKSDGTLQAGNTSGSLVGSASEALANDAWHHVQVRFPDNYQSSTGCKFKVNNGNEISTTYISSTAQQVVTMYLYGTAECPIKFDDVVVDSISGLYLGDVRVLLATPTADVQDGSWTIASGGNTNIFDAVNNKPIVGTSPSAASDANRIESVDSSGDNATDEIRVITDSYAALGVPANAMVTGIIPILVAGEEAGTGTKSISFGLYDNPAGSVKSIADVTNGTSGAIGTYPSAWWWQRGTIAQIPSINRDAGITFNIRKTDTGTRSATVGFIGAYVVYEFVGPPGFRAPAELMMPLLAM